MGRHVNATDIPVTVIAAATQGKPEAISYVLNHYRNYIRKLAIRIKSVMRMSLKMLLSSKMSTLQLLKGLYMRRYINQNEIDGIVVDDIQSFTRNHKVLLEIFADMKKRNIKPISLNTSCEGI